MFPRAANPSRRQPASVPPAPAVPKRSVFQSTRLRSTPSAHSTTPPAKSPSQNKRLHTSGTPPTLAGPRPPRPSCRTPVASASLPHESSGRPSKNPVTCLLLPPSPPYSSSHSNTPAPPACTPGQSTPKATAPLHPDRHLMAASPKSFRSTGSARACYPVPASPRASSHPYSAASPRYPKAALHTPRQ